MSAQQWPCTCLFVPPASGLDGIHVIFIDRSSSVGYVTIMCYGQAWTAFFGAMGGQAIREFFCEADTSYMVNKMSRPKETKAEMKHLARIIDAVKAALNPLPAVETRAEMLDRIAEEDGEALMPGGFN